VSDDPYLPPADPVLAKPNPKPPGFMDRDYSLSDAFGCCGIAFVFIFVAAVAIPNLLSPRSGGNEAAAIGALKAISHAQLLYREQDKDGDGTLNYAASLEELINTGPDGKET
jgi:DUF2950 family protein